MVSPENRKKEDRRAAAALYAAVVEASRREVFYTQGGVPDTLDGRFELLALHLALVLRRLSAASPPLAQALFDHAFAQLDQNLREMGVGDMGIGKRIRHMAESLYGRMQAYRVEPDTPDEVLAANLARNLFGMLKTPPPPALVHAFAVYLRAATTTLAHQPLSAFAKAVLTLPAFDPAFNTAFTPAFDTALAPS